MYYEQTSYSCLQIQDRLRLVDDFLKYDVHIFKRKRNCEIKSEVTLRCICQYGGDVLMRKGSSLQPTRGRLADTEFCKRSPLIYAIAERCIRSCVQVLHSRLPTIYRDPSKTHSYLREFDQ